MQTGVYRLWLCGHDGGSVIGRAWDISRLRGIKGRLTRRSSWYPIAVQPGSHTTGRYPTAGTDNRRHPPTMRLTNYTPDRYRLQYQPTHPNPATMRPTNHTTGKYSAVGAENHQYPTTMHQAVTHQANTRSDTHFGL